MNGTARAATSKTMTGGRPRIQEATAIPPGRKSRHGTTPLLRRCCKARCISWSRCAPNRTLYYLTGTVSKDRTRLFSDSTPEPITEQTGCQLVEWLEAGANLITIDERNRLLALLD